MTNTNNKKWWRDFGVGQETLAMFETHVGDSLYVFDTETTGLSAETDTVIQLSAIKLQIDPEYQTHEVDRFDIYINPGYPLPPKITEITGITDEKLSHYPMEKDQWPKIYAFFGENPNVCGHNSPFDIKMMNAMYNRNVGHDFVQSGLDTLQMARELHLKKEAGSHKLGNLARHFGLDYGLTFHNSMDDVTATVRILRFFIDEYLEKKSKGDPPAGQKVTLISCSPWNGAEFHQPMLQRLYVRFKLDGKRHTLWMNQHRQHEWGEYKKDTGIIDLVDIADLEQQVMKLYNCNDLEELGKVRDVRYVN